MKKSLRFHFSATQKIILSFLVVVLIGSVLLSLPFTLQPGIDIRYIDALFTATTATCVTGLTTVPIYATWNTLGHVIILFLIQIGGLGVIAVLSFLMMSLKKKLGLNDRVILQNAFNLNTLSGLVRFLKKVFLGTLIVEMTGALMYMTVFVPAYGAKGIWYAVFTSVSAFCNAGIDLLGPDSLSAYVLNPVVNFTTAFLIIIGGLGFIVWWDVIEVCKRYHRRGVFALRHLTLHSKLALSATGILLLAGTVLILIFDFHNPDTLGPYNFPEKLMISFFQSTTTRTAGFFTIPQQHFSNGSAFVSLLFMFIGGSPVGTAGGIKTVTFFVLAASVLADIRNQNQISVFNRAIPRQAVSRSLAVMGMSFSIVLISTLLLSFTTQAPALDILYETVSATATVGLTRNLTGTLGTAGKLIITCNMFLGRIGPISLAFAFQMRHQNKNLISNPVEEISIG